MAHAIKPPLADGQTLAVDAGPVIVAVQCIRLGHAYRLSIRHASTGAEIDDLSRSHPAERTARHAARVATALFRSGMTVEQVLDLVAVFRYLTASRVPGSLPPGHVGGPSGQH